jgi:metallo-beta-lactamase family protein
MIGFLGCQDKTQVQKTFLVHGEYETQVKYSSRLQEAGFSNIQIPSPKQEFTV